ncbi:MAG: proline dehydrogenase family protein [Fidelibacterota bacterium]|nr:MAG: proline dehydrogenase family protein [Candidatus Neomarinimicrobiota bacterium]
MKFPSINSLIVASLPYLPKALVGLIARRYVAGETVEEALEVVRRLNEKGFEATLDILGEHVESPEEASAIADEYVELYRRIAQSGLRSSISLKPTHLGLSIDYPSCEQNLLKVLHSAADTDNFLRIDMENSPYTDNTLALYRTCLEQYSHVGLVLQAYLYRSGDDLNGLMSSRLNFRLCKGIYRETPEIAIQDRGAINDNFMALLRQAFEGEAYVGIATHDQPLIAQAEELISQLNVPLSRFEFQVLYGVPMEGKLEALLARGYKVRIYVPFGRAWYDYSLRRLKENPNLAGYVLRNILRR